MTQNQIEYQKLLETQLHNRNSEAETNRANLVSEGLQRDSHNENVRANRAREEENLRSHLAAERENERSNKARETETNRSNLANELIKSQQLVETNRSNLVREAEEHRANLAREIETHANNTLNRATQVEVANISAQGRRDVAQITQGGLPGAIYSEFKDAFDVTPDKVKQGVSNLAESIKTTVGKVVSDPKKTAQQAAKVAITATTPQFESARQAAKGIKEVYFNGEEQQKQKTQRQTGKNSKPVKGGGSRH